MDFYYAGSKALSLRRMLLGYVVLQFSLCAFGGTRISGELLYPAGGEKLVSGDSLRVIWKSDCLAGLCKLVLWDAKSGMFLLCKDSIQADTVGLNVTIWKIPDSVVSNRLRMMLLDTTGGYLISNSFFQVSSNEGFLKSTLLSRGRFGMVPSEINPINLHIAPNPFNPRTSALWDVPLDDADDLVDLRVYDMNVNEVAHPVHDYQSAGKHQVDIDGSKFPSGRYLVSVHTRTHQQSKLIILQR